MARSSLALCVWAVCACSGAGEDADASAPDLGVAADGPASDHKLFPDQPASPDMPSLPADPFKGLQKVNSNPDIYRGKSTFGDGKGELQVWVPAGYTASKAWPLLVFLHGGMNDTGNKESRDSGLNSLRHMVDKTGSKNFIWMAAVIRTSGSYHAWAVKQNTLDMVDGIREVSRRFHVDRRRVYLSGMSMGAGGTASISWILPRAFAAFGPVSGYYWNSWGTVPALKGVSYRVVHGAKDKYPEEPYDRLKLAEQFIKLCKAAGATVERVILPGVGHDYPASEVPKMNAFLIKHANTVPTDWTKAREQVKDYK